MPAPTSDELLAALDPEQREVASTLEGPLCVLAGAGTGKTRAITHRIAHGVASGVYVPQRVLAVTFTARAAGEMRTRLRDLGAAGVQARTFHAAALRQLRYFWPRHVGGELPDLASHKAGLVAEAAGRLRLPTDRATVRDLSGEVEWVKVTMTDRDDYPAAAAKAGRTGPAGLDPASVVRLLTTYETVKRERHVIDFEDVLLYTVGLIAEHRQVADAVRSQYQHLVVDEYQDVSPLQQALLDQWLGDSEQVCVVGDPNQTIYTFAGASPEFLLGFRRRHPTAREVRLVRDYRSTPQVVALANRVVTGSPAGRQAALELVAQRPPGPEPDLRELPDEPAEARHVAARIGELLAAGTPASEAAVLFRTNGQSETYEQALADAGIPYVLHGGERFFDRGEVREARQLLRGAARSVADDAADDGLAVTVRGVLSGGGWSAEPPAGGGAVRERWESLAALARLADDLAAARPDAGLRDFVAELDERADAQHAPTVDGVTLASLHAAKGLEWDAVFVVGVNEGMLPDHLRRDARAGRGGAAAVLRRHHPGPARPLGHLGAGPLAGWPRRPPAVPVPRRHRPQLGPAAGRPPRQGPQGAGLLPGLRQGPHRCPGPQARPLRRLPVVLRRGALRAAARVAGRPGQDRERPGVRRVHRRHAHRAGRGAAVVGARAARGVRRRAVQAGEVRRRRARAGGRRAARRPAPATDPDQAALDL